MAENFQIRKASEADVSALATLWHDGWREAHIDLVPAALAEERTWEKLRDRLVKRLGEVRMVGEVGSPLGFTITKDHELYQLFTAKAARGSGLATALIREFEMRLAQRKVNRVYLYCAIGNERAAKFYRKSNWDFVGSETAMFETSKEAFEMETWRFEKQLF